MPFRDPAARRAYMKTYRETHRPQQRTYAARHRASHPAATAAAHTFVGVDGEGYTDAIGRHHYMCLIAGEDVLYTGAPLSAEECLEFLASLPVEKNQIYVSFFFDYDSTMILRDFLTSRPDKARILVNMKDRDDPFWTPRRYGSFVNWRGFGIDYVPRKHISVRRSTRDGVKPDPAVVIHDVRAFYQMAFAKALDTFHIGTEAEREFIRRMKAERAQFDPAEADEIIAYSKVECRLLADMVALMRDRFVDVGLNPYPYEGPGSVAGKVLTARVTGKERMTAIRSAVPEQVWDLAIRAYYGGRFEITAHGTIGTRVYEYDIKSAYPHAMTRLPCLVHGVWTPGRHGDLWVGEVAWSMPETDSLSARDAAGLAGPLPVRRRDHSIHFPAAGRGWYWSVEVPPYAELVGECWSYRSTCDCEPFSFVPEMYQRRADLESESAGSGIGLKLTLNSLYGKLAQRIGAAPHYNPVWAGLITALTRAKVYDVYRNHPGKVIMFATDAVFTIEPCPELDLGSALGQWELCGPFDDLVIFQPGVYFSGGEALFKTRGVPAREFRDRAAEFRAAADDFATTIELQLSNHLGMRLGLSRGQRWYDRVGDWLPAPRKMTADPSSKRTLQRDPDGRPLTIPALGLHRGLYGRDGAWWSWPHPGGVDVATVPYAPPEDPAAAVFDDSLQWEEGLHDGA
jgi:hypothetical protein